MMNAFISFFYYPGCSVPVQLSLRLSLQLSCGPGEAISIRETLTETSLQLRGPWRSRLWFGVDWGVWQAGEVSSSPTLPLSLFLSLLFSLSLSLSYSLSLSLSLSLPLSLPLCVVQSADHLGEMEEEDRVPIQLILSARQCIFPPSVCV